MASFSNRLSVVAKMKATKVVLWVFAGLGAVTVIAIAGLALTFTPAKLDVPTVDVGALPPASPPAGMSISALPTGTYDTPAALTYRGGSWSDTRHLASTPVLIRHPKGNLLIDSGFGRQIDAHMLLIPAMQRSPHHKLVPVVDQLAAGGILGRPGATTTRGQREILYLAANFRGSHALGFYRFEDCIQVERVAELHELLAQVCDVYTARHVDDHLH